MLFLVADGEGVLSLAGADQEPYLIASDIESNYRKHIKANMWKQQSDDLSQGEV